MIKLLLIVSLSILSGCDYFKNLKFKYYYNYKGEMSCLITDSTQKNAFEFTSENLDKKIAIENIQTNQPILYMKKNKMYLSKLFENDTTLNIQHLNKTDGSSTIIFINKLTGKGSIIILGNNNEEYYNINNNIICQ